MEVAQAADAVVPAATICLPESSDAPLPAQLAFVLDGAVSSQSRLRRMDPGCSGPGARFCEMELAGHGISRTSDVNHTGRTVTQVVGRRHVLVLPQLHTVNAFFHTSPPAQAFGFDGPLHALERYLHPLTHVSDAIPGLQLP